MFHRRICLFAVIIYAGDNPARVYRMIKNIFFFKCKEREREFKRESFSLFFLFRLLFLLIKTIETNRTVDPELFLYFWLLKKLMVSTGVAVSYSIQGYNH